jgi:hypothetical protein
MFWKRFLKPISFPWFFSINACSSFSFSQANNSTCFRGSNGFSALCTSVSINGSYSYMPRSCSLFLDFFSGCFRIRIVWFYHVVLSSVLKLTNLSIIIKERRNWKIHVTWIFFMPTSIRTFDNLLSLNLTIHIDLTVGLNKCYAHRNTSYVFLSFKRAETPLLFWFFSPTSQHTCLIYPPSWFSWRVKMAD